MNCNRQSIDEKDAFVIKAYMANPYAIEYSEDAVRHLERFTADVRSSVLDAIEKQLLYEPATASKKRRLLRPNVMAAFRLRVGNQRVYYKVTEEPRLVSIVAVGVKKGTQVFIEGKEVFL